MRRLFANFVGVVLLVILGGSAILLLREDLNENPQTIIVSPLGLESVQSASLYPGG